MHALVFVIKIIWKLYKKNNSLTLHCTPFLLFTLRFILPWYFQMPSLPVMLLSLKSILDIDHGFSGPTLKSFTENNLCNISLSYHNFYHISLKGSIYSLCCGVSNWHPPPRRGPEEALLKHLPSLTFRVPKTYHTLYWTNFTKKYVIRGHLRKSKEARKDLRGSRWFPWLSLQLHFYSWSNFPTHSIS